MNEILTQRRARESVSGQIGTSLGQSQQIEAESWLHCARFIGEMLVLSDVIDPNIHLATPLVCHCFYVAECCFIYGESSDNRRQLTSSDLERTNRVAGEQVVHSRGEGEPTNEPGPNQTRTSFPDSKGKTEELFAAIALEQIATCKQGLLKQAQFWQGTWKTQALFDGRLMVLPSLNFLKRFRNLSRTAGKRLGDNSNGWLGNRRNLQGSPSTNSAASASPGQSIRTTNPAVISAHMVQQPGECVSGDGDGGVRFRVG